MTFISSSRTGSVYSFRCLRESYVKLRRLFVALATLGIAIMSHAAVSPLLVIHGGPA